ncbi:hypothetical protein SBA5_40012 [Candidatus Sulfotelmatomonas gaucii]|uniref:Uncharacterized protein n=1 Tax=Candidatus Sulfuritelmatomonas gaucii TaxID=2043161 RepID=A0A2N9LJN9_9BACT|nr:hypothetical protein SBA5_40012 [Candidatus Sulfotelmatomonas gaucii]
MAQASRPGRSSECEPLGPHRASQMTTTAAPSYNHPGHIF